jgi:hypothetical protein
MMLLPAVDFYCELQLPPVDGELSTIVHQEVLNGNQSAYTKARKFLVYLKMIVRPEYRLNTLIKRLVFFLD